MHFVGGRSQSFGPLISHKPANNTIQSKKEGGFKRETCNYVLPGNRVKSGCFGTGVASNVIINSIGVGFANFSHFRGKVRFILFFHCFIQLKKFDKKIDGDGFNSLMGSENPPSGKKRNFYIL